MQKSLPSTLLMLLAAALAGTTAAVLVSNSLERYATSLLNDRRFAALTSVPHLQNPTTLEESLLNTQETLLNSVVALVDADAKTSLQSPLLSEEVFVRGEGIVVSADGWVLTTRDQLVRYADGKTYTGFSLVQGKKIFTVDKVVLDTQTDAVAVHAVNAQGWTPLELAEPDAILPGAMLFGLGESGDVHTLYAVGRTRDTEEAVYPADEPHTLWRVSPEDLFAGMPLVNTEQQLFGFMNGEGLVVPAQALRPFIRQALRGSMVVHAALGVYVASLSEVTSLDPSLTQGYTQGALIIAKTGERTAIINKGPADDVGLTDGDILLSLDDVRITETITCADILATYAPGQTVTLSVARNGEVQDMDVTLGTWEELVY
jgi:S1-C subfamily serine protease